MAPKDRTSVTTQKEPRVVCSVAHEGGAFAAAPPAAIGWPRLRAKAVALGALGVANEWEVLQDADHGNTFYYKVSEGATRSFVRSEREGVVPRGRGSRRRRARGRISRRGEPTALRCDDTVDDAFVRLSPQPATDDYLSRFRSRLQTTTGASTPARRASASSADDDSDGESD